MVVAVVLLVLAAAVVAATAASGSVLLITGAAALAVVLGAAATRITHTELIDSRTAAARDRAEQARAYADLTATRTAENVEFASDMTGQVARRDATISRLEKRLTEAAGELAQARRDLGDARDRAERTEADLATTRRSLAAADERATQAVVRVAELEHEIDVLRAEWQAAATAQEGTRRRAV
ncbi:hypothetical protein GCM10025786_19850 [Nocardioides caeni]|uniref:Uncharacterized protein n=1 Tax=Nocardioides caeni TaxID=574700 RepID=A0A4S8NDC3_9ACTN|nr:hypothetical protein E9934_11160 [Nocardioides caeni]